MTTHTGIQEASIPATTVVDAADSPEVLPAFVAGLEELLAALGGRATAREMAAALAAGENRHRFGALRSALGQLLPHLGGGAPIVHAERNPGGVTWAVRGPAPPRDRRPTDEPTEEDRRR